MGTLARCRQRPGVIRYLLDSSALWRILRDPALRAAFADLYQDVAVPKAAWTWIESAQYRNAGGHP
jgi:hypothetical protein